MVRKGKDRRRQKRQADAKRRRQRRAEQRSFDLPHDPEPGPDELFSKINSALADPDPIAFLALASTLAHTVDPRARSPLDPDPLEIDAEGFVDMLADIPARETAALLHAFSVLLPNELLAAKAQREARRQTFPLPEWLTRLRDTTVTSTSVLRDELGESENVNISIKLPAGEEQTIIVLVDHNLGSAAKDGFLVPGGFEVISQLFREAASGGPRIPEMVEIDPANARAQLTDAISLGATIFPPLESESWPQARPLVEWVLRLLPEGGVGYELKEWTEKEKNALSAQFLKSPEAVELSDPDDQEIVNNLLWFTTEYSGGDPLRWSPANVEILMGDWFTRRIIAPNTYLLRMPTVLEAFIRYAHRTRGISGDASAATLRAVAALTPAYVELVQGGARPEEANAQREIDALLGALDLPDDGPGSWRWMRAVEMVGSEGVLNRLTADPLPDEDFAWTEIAEDIRPRVREILSLCDSCAEEFFDYEYRTAFRRVLARTAQADPAMFRRSSKNETAAAAIVWIVAAANERLRPVGNLTAKEVFAHFGVSGSVAARARPFLRTYGADENQQTIGFALGSAEVLTSSTRARLIAVRDQD